VKLADFGVALKLPDFGRALAHPCAISPVEAHTGTPLALLLQRMCTRKCHVVPKQWQCLAASFCSWRVGCAVSRVL
jgi:hypothetical protein